MSVPVLNEPNIRINNVPLIEQDFAWSLIPGAYPFEEAIIVPKGDLNDALKVMPNPVSLEMKVWGGTGEYDEKQIKFEQLYLIEPREIDDYNVSWRLADKRWAWRGKKIFCSYNKTRLKNQVGLGSIDALPTDPAALRQYWDTFAQGRYLPWSVKQDGMPYTIAEILIQELFAQEIVVDADDTQGHGIYFLENVEFQGVDIYHFISEMLRKSRLELGIFQDGRLELYSIDFFDEQKDQDLLTLLSQKERTEPGRLFRSEMSRVRPKNISVLFEKKCETWLITSSSEDLAPNQRLPLSPHGPILQSDIDDRRAIACENVIRIPYPIYSSIDYRIYQIGEYIPIWKYIRALGLTDIEVRELWFSSLLEQRLAQIFTAAGGGAQLESNYNLAHSIVAVIRAHYRKIYQIEPFFLDRIASWETRRVAVIDNYSHYNPISPLFADYCLVPKVRTPSVAKATAGWQHLAYNWVVNVEDPYRQKPTAGTVYIVSEPFGVFGVAYPQDVDQILQETIPSAIDNLPLIAPGVGNLWTQAHLKPQHTLETIISVVWDVSKNDSYFGAGKYYFINFNWANNLGPNISYLSKLEYARMGLAQVGSDIDVTVPLNDNMIRTFAMSESVKLMNQFRDRVVGLITFAGFGPVPLKLYGNMKSLTYSFSRARGLETILDMREIPFDPSIEQLVNQNEINFLHRHVTRADDKNQI